MANSKKHPTAKEDVAPDDNSGGGGRSKSAPANLAESTRERDMVDQAGYRERVYKIVRRIPEGHVMTYGQLADILGEGYTARTVGFVMHTADEHDPWHRVINAQGACSTGRVLLPSNKQQRMLEAEGIEFDARGRCDLSRHRWTPEEAEQLEREREQEADQPSLFND